MSTIKNQVSELKSKLATEKDWLDFFRASKTESDILDKVFKKTKLTDREELIYSNCMGKVKLAKLDAKEYNAGLTAKNEKIQDKIDALKVQRKAEKILEEAYKQLKEICPKGKVMSVGMDIDGEGYKCKLIKTVKLQSKKDVLKRMKVQASKKQDKDGTKGKTNQ
jgi:hypothetical protein